MAKETKLEVVDSSGLSDADWADINRLRQAFADGGSRAFWDAMDELGKIDLFRQVHIAGAFFRDTMREAIKDEMAAAGMSEDDLRDTI